MPRSTRRRLLAGLATLPLLPAAFARAANTPAAAPSPSPSPSPAAAAAADAPSALAESLAEAAHRRFAAHLPFEDVPAVASAIEDGLQSAASLRAVKLGNGDAPVTSFSPRIAPPSAAKARR